MVKRGKALALTLGAIVFLGVVAFFVVAVRPLLAKADLGPAGRVLLEIVGWLVLAALVLVGIGLLYRFAVKDSPGGWLGFLTLGTAAAMVGASTAAGSMVGALTAAASAAGSTVGASTAAASEPTGLS